jgi:hypothetical protein
MVVIGFHVPRPTVLLGDPPTTDAASSSASTRMIPSPAPVGGRNLGGAITVAWRIPSAPTVAHASACLQIKVGTLTDATTEQLNRYNFSMQDPTGTSASSSSTSTVMQSGSRGTTASINLKEILVRHCSFNPGQDDASSSSAAAAAAAAADTATVSGAYVPNELRAQGWIPIGCAEIPLSARLKDSYKACILPALVQHTLTAFSTQGASIRRFKTQPPPTNGATTTMALQQSEACWLRDPRHVLVVAVAYIQAFKMAGWTPRQTPETLQTLIARVESLGRQHLLLLPEVESRRAVASASSSSSASVNDIYNRWCGRVMSLLCLPSPSLTDMIHPHLGGTGRGVRSVGTGGRGNGGAMTGLISASTYLQLESMLRPLSRAFEEGYPLFVQSVTAPVASTHPHHPAPPASPPASAPASPPPTSATHSKRKRTCSGFSSSSASSSSSDADCVNDEDESKRSRTGPQSLTIHPVAAGQLSMNGDVVAPHVASVVMIPCTSHQPGCQGAFPSNQHTGMVATPFVWNPTVTGPIRSVLRLTACSNFSCYNRWVQISRLYSSLDVQIQQTLDLNANAGPGGLEQGSTHLSPSTWVPGSSRPLASR